MHPPSSLTSRFDYVYVVLRGNRRQFLVEKILSEEEECFDPHGKEFRFC